MRRHLIIAAVLAAFAATPAWSEDSKGKVDMEQAVTLSPVALPIVVDGRLVNYVFVTAKVLLTPQADVLTLRDKEPYFRDALVRAAYRTPFVLRNDYNNIDQAKMKAALWRDAAAIIGARNVAGVAIVGVPTAQHRLISPH
jgi:hypothetical protein